MDAGTETDFAPGGTRRLVARGHLDRTLNNGNGRPGKRAAIEREVGKQPHASL